MALPCPRPQSETVESSAGTQLWDCVLPNSPGGTHWSQVATVLSELLKPQLPGADALTSGILIPVKNKELWWFLIINNKDVVAWKFTGWGVSSVSTHDIWSSFSLQLPLGNLSDCLTISPNSLRTKMATFFSWGYLVEAEHCGNLISMVLCSLYCTILP